MLRRKLLSHPLSLISIVPGFHMKIMFFCLLFQSYLISDSISNANLREIKTGSIQIKEGGVSAATSINWSRFQVVLMWL